MTKKIFTFTLAMMFSFMFIHSYAQKTAKDFSGMDCNGNYHKLFDDLDSGKIVFLHFYMASCGSCPPAAQKIQKMANNIMKKYPGKIKGYAFPYTNSTTCSYSAGWVTSNSLGMYIPMDSGADMVSFYGGFGMPTVVMLGGGKSHKVMYKSLAFVTKDTTKMRDSILAFFGSSTAVEITNSPVLNIELFPNPGKDYSNLYINFKESTHVRVELLNITGSIVSVIADEKTAAGSFTTTINTTNLPQGSYLIRINAGGNISHKNLLVIH